MIICPQETTLGKARRIKGSRAVVRAGRLQDKAWGRVKAKGKARIVGRINRCRVGLIVDRASRRCRLKGVRRSSNNHRDHSTCSKGRRAIRADRLNNALRSNNRNSKDSVGTFPVVVHS